MAGFNNVTDFYPQITGQLTVYPGPINQVTATVDNNVGTPRVEVTQTPTDQGMNILFAFFNLKGEQGETGNGIQSIAKTATVGLVDTYTITYTDGTTSTFNVTNGAKGDTGNGIQSIAKTGTSGLVDTYTITFTNGQTTTFTVTNGAKGDTGETGNGIASIAKTSTSGLVDTYTITFTDGTTTTFDVTNGEDGTVTTDQLMEAIANQLPTDSASGSIASFPDGADDIPVKSLIAQITPVQDLHGYDKPWPAGGGKNKLNPALYETFPKSDGGITMSLNSDGSITVNGTASTNMYFIVVPYTTLSDYGFFQADTSYTLSGYYSAGLYAMFGIQGSGTDYRALVNGVTMSFSAEQIASLKYRVVIFVANGTQLNNVTIKPMICLSSATDPAVFAPYSNECPISGWTGAKITRTGKNLWDEEWEVGNISYETGANQNVNTMIRSKNFIPIPPSTSFFVKNPLGKYILTRFYDKDKNYIGYEDANGNSTVSGAGAVRVMPSNAYYFRFSVGDAISSYNNDISINYPSTDHDYHSGTSNKSVDVSWTDEAGTVYGGTLNVTTGLLTTIFGRLNLGALTWNTLSYNRWYASIAGAKLPPDATTVANALAEQYEIVSQDALGADVSLIGLAISSTGLVIVRNGSDSITPEGYLCYELATPQTYQLTPTEVKTLIGDNSIWADCGDVDVTYRADIAKYIAKQLAAVQALILENQ